ncbi:MAG: peptide chain release factor 2 [Ruminococcus sp.]|nr:peptide chain release factor 2 [Ruminococcus sp.]
MHFDVAGLKKEIAELDEQCAAPDFWDDMKNSQAVLQKAKNLKDKLADFENIETTQQDALMMIEMAEEENDASLVGEIKSTVDTLTAQIDKMRLATLLSGKYDSSNAILTFHAGASGTEAQDWCEMLIRMYQMWAQKNGYKSEIMDTLPGDEAGIKSCTMEISGLNAYGYLKAEKGIHRLVRISPFNSQGKRMTSFASVEVMPELDDNIDVDIRPEDVKMDVFRASGAGGQHINKTSSAVRLTHVPTGIVTSCQTQRSQLQNREYAMKMLKAKLVELAEQQQKETISEIKGVQTDNGWGNQIRSYVFQPYTMVKDLRTGFEMGNIGAVMDGELNGFINAYLTAASLGTLKK